MTRQKNQGPKIQTEKKTVAYMIQIYCHKKHQRKLGELCPDCQTLSDYTQERLDYCRFGEQKTTCQKCPVHCYRKDMRERVKLVMRYAGPRMLFYHPSLAVKHLIKNFQS